MDRNGRFSIELEYSFPYQQIWLTIDKYFYSAILANKGLSITFDLTKLKRKPVEFSGEGVSYRGPDAALNEWLGRSMLYTANEMDKVPEDLPLDSLYKIKGRIDHAFATENPSGFEWLSENERMSNYYSRLLHAAYISGKQPILWDAIKAHKPYLISNNGMTFVRSLYSYYVNVASKLNLNNYSVRKEVRELDSLFGEPLANLLKLQIFRDDPKDNALILKDLIAETQTQWVREVLKKRYETACKHLREVDSILKDAKPLAGNLLVGEHPESLSFGAQLSILPDMEAKDFLAKLKRAYPGKTIILDLWATWCKPCISQMAYSKELYRLSSDLPVQFVYLCSNKDSDISKWKNKIAEFRQPGIHFFTGHKLVEELMAMVNTASFPTYICLAPSGKIVPNAIKSMSATNIDDIKRLVNADEI
ncbi:TlpA family protein disulfide reductase [Pararcticibacter amylolyticus]|uniref:TlpA family protein disulfide reductase n=1 Tax=Pararcticibacter amylolyticus TaxID=2173175 RepID=UPI001304AAE8|nr:TlpA disulfide reductase family protein [Pararcticibacter amylolyticus]